MDEHEIDIFVEEMRLKHDRRIEQAAFRKVRDWIAEQEMSKQPRHIIRDLEDEFEKGGRFDCGEGR